MSPYKVTAVKRGIQAINQCIIRCQRHGDDRDVGLVAPSRVYQLSTEKKGQQMDAGRETHGEIRNN